MGGVIGTRKELETSGICKLEEGETPRVVGGDSVIQELADAGGGLVDDELRGAGWQAGEIGGKVETSGLVRHGGAKEEIGKVEITKSGGTECVCGLHWSRCWDQRSESRIFWGVVRWASGGVGGGDG